MSIIFHCESCKKKIQAPEGTGGKYANCPHCKHRVYIPVPKEVLDEQDELTLAPLDEEEEQKRQRLMRETYALQQTLLKQKEMPEGAESSPAANSSAAVNPNGPDDRELLKQIIIAIRNMVDGNIDRADASAKALGAYKKRVVNLLDRLAVNDMPEPELADVPAAVLVKFIRAFRAKI